MLTAVLACLLAAFVATFVLLLRRHRRLLEQIAADRRAEAELHLDQKHEAVGRLAAGVAHEINTPAQFVGDTVRFLRGAFRDVLAMHEQVRADLEASPQLLERVREAEEAADLDYLRERVPAAFDRAEDGLGRVAAVGGAMRELAQPTGDMAPQDLSAQGRTKRSQS